MSRLDEATRTLEVHGSLEEVAFQQGRANAHRVVPLIASLQSLPGMPAWIPSRVFVPAVRSAVFAIGAHHLRRHRSAIESFAGGGFARSVEHLARGLGVDVRTLFGAQVLELLTSNMTYTAACTSLAFAADATETGAPLIAYNHDFPPAWAPFSFVRRRRPDRGYASVSLSYPVTLGALAGVNEAGLAVSLNHAFADDLHRRPAVMISWMVTEVLTHCARVDEALERLRGLPTANGSMMTLADETGARAALEFSATRQAVRRTSAPILTTFNAYQCPETRAREIPYGAIGKGFVKGMDIHLANVERQARFDALLPSLPQRFSRDHIQRLMADHGAKGPGSGTLCRHEDPACETLLSAVLDPAARRLSVAFDRPCRGAYVDYDVTPSSARAVA